MHTQSDNVGLSTEKVLGLVQTYLQDRRISNTDSETTETLEALDTLLQAKKDSLETDIKGLC